LVVGNLKLAQSSIDYLQSNQSKNAGQSGVSIPITPGTSYQTSTTPQFNFRVWYWLFGSGEEI